jgi:hypothetical protein
LTKCRVALTSFFFSLPRRRSLRGDRAALSSSTLHSSKGRVGRDDGLLRVADLSTAAGFSFSFSSCCWSCALSAWACSRTDTGKIIHFVFELFEFQLSILCNGSHGSFALQEMLLSSLRIWIAGDLFKGKQNIRIAVAVRCGYH